MEGGNQNNHNQNNMYNYPYAYDQYGFYYPQNYNTSAPVPQGDPSAALSSMVYQLQHQTHQRQALGAMAAASITSTLGQRSQNADYYTDYYPQDQRSVINYKDLSQQTTATVEAPAKEPVEDPLAKKPKFCCNRWLKSAIAVAQHEKLHIQCPSCDYMCLKSALQEHEENFHGKEKIESNKKPSRPDGMIPPNAPRIETPEELEAWILARKKNWPTKDNVERKEKEDAEKEARGELPNKKRKPNTKRDQQLAKRQKIEEKKNSLVAQYDSDSDSDSDIMDLEKDAISSKDPSAMGKILLPEDRPKRRCRYFAMGKCSKGDECGFSHEKLEPKPKQPRAAPTFKKRPNLLFKLLEKEILQEKSVILQCLRYIVDNKHFGKGSDPSIKREENSISRDNEDNIEKVDIKTLEVETLASLDANSPSIEDVTKVLEGESSLDLEQADQSEFLDNNDASVEPAILSTPIDTLSTP